MITGNGNAQPGGTGGAGPPGQSFRLYIGSGTPPTDFGRNGDTAVRESDGRVFTKASDAWTDTGVTLAGAPGASLLLFVGSGLPDSSFGIDGDTAVRGSDGELLSREAGGWSDTGLSLRGPKGDPGSAGTGGGGGALSEAQTRAIFLDYPPATSQPGYVGVARVMPGNGMNAQKKTYLPYGAGTYVFRFRLYITNNMPDGASEAPSAPANAVYGSWGTFDNVPPNPVYVKVSIRTATGLVPLTFEGSDTLRLDPAAMPVDSDPIDLAAGDLLSDTTGSYITQCVYQFADNTLPAASDGNYYLVYFDGVQAEGASKGPADPDKRSTVLSTAGDGFWAEDARILNWPGSVGGDARRRVVQPVGVAGDSRTALYSTYLQKFFLKAGIPYTAGVRAVANETNWSQVTNPAANPTAPALSFGRHRRLRGFRILHHEYGVNDLTLATITLASMQALYINDLKEAITRGPVERAIFEHIFGSSAANPLTGATMPDCFNTLADQIPDWTRYFNDHIRVALNLWFDDPVWGVAGWFSRDVRSVDTPKYVVVDDVAPLINSSGGGQATVTSVGATSLTLSEVSRLPNPAGLATSSPSMPKGYPYVAGGTPGWAVILNGQTVVYTALNASTKTITVPGGTNGIGVGDAVSVPCQKFLPNMTADGLHPLLGASAVSTAMLADGLDELYYL